MLRVTAQLIRSVASADIVASCRICIIDRRSVFLCACILWNREICDTVIERKRIGARLLKAELREGFSYINFLIFICERDRLPFYDDDLLPIISTDRITVIYRRVKRLTCLTYLYDHLSATDCFYRRTCPYIDRILIDF